MMFFRLLARCARAMTLLSVGSTLMACALTPLTLFGSAHAQGAPTFTNVAVHDPSIVPGGGAFWVFGSHLAAARTYDGLNWQLMASGVNQANPLFNDVTKELAEALAWAQTDTLWAPDVVQLADGKFYMYYNACKGDSPRSAMGLAVADRIEGPYVNKGIFLKSGMWGLPSEDGSVYDAQRHPNVVDPNTFFDAQRNLWMVYGSYSGGIFILKMNPATGFPLPGQGYGKRLMGGNHARIEGAYVLYSPATQYYYLFTSFGGLAADGGYQIRVARSRAPDGPYVDAAGTDMAAVKANPALPLFDDASIAPHGVKLIGNFRFDRKAGEATLGGAGTGAEPGYVSPGHNSAIYDPGSGKHYLIFHTRFPNRGEQHEVRVHQMVMNSADWPLITPYRTVHEGLGAVSAQAAAGDWLVVYHGKDISPAIKPSYSLTLQADGTLSGVVTGSWQIVDGYRIRLTPTGMATFDGVLATQWSESLQAWTLSLTALWPDGTPLHGTQLPARSEAQVATAVAAELSLGDTSAVTGDLALPWDLARGATVTWVSSNPAVVDANGRVSRPAAGQGNATVTLTATVRRGASTATRMFTVVVREQAIDGLLAHYSFNGTFNATGGGVAAARVIGNRIDVPNGGNVGFVAGMGGNSGLAASFDGNSGLRLPDALIANRAVYSVALWVRPEALTEFTPTFFGARDASNWVSLVPRGHSGVNGETMLWSGAAWYDAGTGSMIPVGQWSHLAFAVNNGMVKVWVNGVLKFSGANFPNVFNSGSSVFTLGVNWWDTPFKGQMDELRVYQTALTEAQVQALAVRP